MTHRPRSAAISCVLATLLGFPGAARVEADDPTDRPRRLRDVPETIVEDFERVVVTLRAARFVEAEREARAFLAAAESEFGAQSREAGLALDLLVEARVRGGRATDPETRSLAERAVAVKESAVGPEHPLTARSLQLLAWIERAGGNFDAARALLRRQLAICETSHGPDDVDTGAALNSLGNLLLDAGRFAEAKPHFERTLTILEKEHGPEHADLAVVLNNLALAHEQLAEFDDAHRLHLRALQLRRAGLGPEHPDVAQSLDNLAILTAVSGDLWGSIPWFREALAIREKSLGAEHPEVSKSLNNLANVTSSLGDLLEARHLYERAFAILAQRLGPEHPETARTVFNLGRTLHDLGDLEEADERYREALRVRRATLGPDHPDVATTLVARGRLLQERGRSTDAVALQEEALAIRAKALGEAHPAYAAGLADLGTTRRSLGELAEAERLQRRALAIREKTLPPTHPEIATNLGELGETRRRRGEATEALALHDRALAIHRESLGPDHPAVATELRRRADALADLGRLEESLAAALEAETIGREHVKLTARGLSEREAMRHASHRATGVELALSLVARDPADTAAIRSTWSSLVRSRALILDEMARRQRTLSHAPSGVLEEEAERLAGARRRLANLTMRGPAEEPPDRYRRLLEDTRREKEELERDLAQRSASFREPASAGAGLAEVARALPDGSALLAYARHDDGRQAGYVALVLREGDAFPIARSLGPADEIDADVAAWHERMGAGPDARGIVRRDADSRTDTAEIRTLGESVRRRLWDPVEPLLEDAELVFVVPDGAVHLVCLDVLPYGQDSWLAETAPLVHYLSAERDLVRFGGDRRSGDGLLAIGGPDFDVAAAGPGIAGSGTTRRPPTESPTRGADSPGDCDAARSLRFLPLPWAAAEVDELSSVWTGRPSERPATSRRRPGRVERLTGTRATEAAVKARIAGRQIVHFATHAFVLAEGCVSPLLRSGLALAGANRREEIEGEEDGILTAEEIASLDLTGTEWAVLSACETGLGEIRAGEGILGLRRAFETAGAGTLVMSLWPVSDRVTRTWMQSLYEARFEEERSTPAAVRRANLSMLETRRRTEPDAHPAMWGGFVAAGDWR